MKFLNQLKKIATSQYWKIEESDKEAVTMIRDNTRITYGENFVMVVEFSDDGGEIKFASPDYEDDETRTKSLVNSTVDVALESYLNDRTFEIQAGKSPIKSSIQLSNDGQIKSNSDQWDKSNWGVVDKQIVIGKEYPKEEKGKEVVFDVTKDGSIKGKNTQTGTVYVGVQVDVKIDIDVNVSVSNNNSVSSSTGTDIDSLPSLPKQQYQDPLSNLIHIGRVTQRRMYVNGITSFDQVARMTDVELTAYRGITQNECDDIRKEAIYFINQRQSGRIERD